MRRRQTMVVVLAGAILAAGLADRPVWAAPSKNAQVATAYKKARKLYRQGRYAEAIKAFDEVKDLRYHPILDYGIASCYEALRDYNKAVYYLEKYVRNHSKFKMSPKHPSVSDVREKIKVLKARAQAAASGTAPPAGPGPVTSGTPTSATPGQPAHSGAMPGDPIPGPDPYAVPPPPGGGGTGAVYGGGGAAPPPPRYRVRRRAPARRSLMLSVDIGATSFSSGGNGAFTDGVGTGGGVFATALWRFIPWLAVGVHGGVTAMDSAYCDAYAFDCGTLYFATGLLEVRGILPIGPLDLWGSLGLGYGTVVQPVNDYDSYTISGAALAAGVGLDWFLVPRFSIGILSRVYKIFPTKYCDETGACTTSDLGSTDPGVAWYAGLSATWHYPLYFGRHRR